MSGKTHYTCAELAALKLWGYPRTERGWRRVVEREAWAFREVKAKAGRWAVRREYLPPESVLNMVASMDSDTIAPVLTPHIRYVDDVADVTLTLTVSSEQAQKILRMLKRSHRG